ncbi:MAG: hypothetical protein MK102_16695, partial [Fuerstiella sp.]|nr:hypothetical protein [Fuerstiella sp.]
MLKLTRRQLLHSATATIPLLPALPVGKAAVAQEKQSVVIDTHLHCFAGKDSEFPYHNHAPYQPESAATPKHLLNCMTGAGVDFAVVVHPEPYQDDHRYLEHCLKAGGSQL